jgi:hypothetical protein
MASINDTQPIIGSGYGLTLVSRLGRRSRDAWSAAATGWCWPTAMPNRLNETMLVSFSCSDQTTQSLSEKLRPRAAMADRFQRLS